MAKGKTTKHKRICTVCGCSADRACFGGCIWTQLEPPICSRCDSDKPYVAVTSQVNGQAVHWVSEPGPVPPQLLNKIRRCGLDYSPAGAKAMAKRLNSAYRRGLVAGFHAKDKS